MGPAFNRQFIIAIFNKELDKYRKEATDKGIKKYLHTQPSVTRRENTDTLQRVINNLSNEAIDVTDFRTEVGDIYEEVEADHKKNAKFPLTKSRLAKRIIKAIKICTDHDAEIFNDQPHSSSSNSPGCY